MLSPTALSLATKPWILWTHITLLIAARQTKHSFVLKEGICSKEKKAISGQWGEWEGMNVEGWEKRPQGDRGK